MEVYNFEVLYSSIKLEPACILLYHLLLENILEEADPVILRDLCHLLIHEAYFEFNSEYFKQAAGVSTGSPLAGVLASGLPVRKKECELFQILLLTVKLYRRYIDDIIIIIRK